MPRDHLRRFPRSSDPSRPAQARPGARPPRPDPRRAGPHPAFGDAPADSTEWLFGPHAVEEALRAQRPLQYVMFVRERGAASAPPSRLSALQALARSRGVPVRLEPRTAFEALARAHGAPHQGVLARAEVRPTLALETLLERAAASARCLVALDGIEDPHNLGAIARSAAASGADGLILPARRAAGLTAAVQRAAAGALAYLPVARVGNLVHALEQLKAAGYWIYGLAESAPRTLWQTDWRGPVVLVIGGEGNGLHALVRQRCDQLVSIPMHQPHPGAGLASLNASVAAGIALFEIVRQRRGPSPV